MRREGGRSVPCSVRRQGYVMYVVLVLLALLAIAVVLALRDTAHGFQEAASARASAEIRGALQVGVNAAMAFMQEQDPADLINPNPGWDIFQNQPALLGPTLWPPSGRLANAFSVTVGLRTGQQVQGASGHSADKHYGHVVEIQVLVTVVDASLPPSEERLTVGVLVPRERSHAN